MATFTKSGARKPLAVGRAGMSFGMNADRNGGAYGVSFTVEGNDERMYGFHMTNAELDRAVMTRQTFGEQHEVAFTEAALGTAGSERDKDTDEGLTPRQQLQKGLDMAYTMLRTFMPGSEQDGNATLAYIASMTTPK